MNNTRITYADLGFALLMWVLLILRMGYTYGPNDHIELLPYVLFLHDPALYPHDLFIQSLHASLPNERTVMAHLLLPFAGHLRPAVFLFHFFNTILLILALIRIGKRFIGQSYLAWLAVFTSVLVLNDKGLGNVDIYTPAIQAGDVSCMVIAWAINFFLDRKYLLTSVLMSAATFIHVLEGFDAMAILCGVMFLKYWMDREISIRQLLSFYAIYGFTAVIYLYFIYRAKTHNAGALTEDEIFWIMFVFRHPHHFIFSTFPVFNKVFFVICAFISISYYPGRSRTVFQFFAIGLTGLVLYIIGVDFLHYVFVANFQFYKVVSWLKFLSIVAMFGYAASFLRNYIGGQRKIVNYLTCSAGLIGVAFLFFQFATGKMDSGYRQEYNASEISLSLKLKELTTKDAVFIQPFEMTALKFYAQRSSYVEFKAIAKNQKDLKIWYDRIREVFGLDYYHDRLGFGMAEKANTHLANLSEAELSKLKGEGVTHIICHDDKYSARHKLILAENNYFVYEL